MLIQVPVGRYSTPDYALVDTTAMSIEPEPFTPRVDRFDSDRMWVQAWQCYASEEALPTLAAKHKLTVEEAHAILTTTRDEAREYWRNEASRALNEGYRNAVVVTPSGHTIATHATVAEIRTAIFDAHAKGEPVATVMHRYDPLPEFDERGLPADTAKAYGEPPF